MNKYTPDRRLFEQRHGVTFIDCLHMSIHSELVPQWERLSGKQLLAQNPLERMIDEATGYDQTMLKEFVDFVYEYVFVRL